ncbi:MAG TPA: tRNA (adenosine(37)-N6)-threonylcarbamoyltransferase complex transferase subunit TsaD [Patescibacteria group bacterium]
MRILAIETSCDETAAAVMERTDTSPWVKTITSVVASQAKLHEKYGGVYPEVASREHIRKILPVIAEALDLPLHERGRLPNFSAAGIDYLAVTVGPGLIGSLLVGTQTIASLGYATGLPILPVNHLAGHIYASFIATESVLTAPDFPLLSLVVSGGHTMLIYMKGHHQYELIGQTRDDAAGEAFDKVAKLLGLGYPGGPLVSQLARKGNRHAYKFPIGLEHEDTCDFSFSGLKTAVLREVQKAGALSEQGKADIAASFERAAIEALLLKTSRALQSRPVRHFILGGGVAANNYLRERLATLLAHKTPAVTLHVPPSHLCTDNAEVIGAAAAFSNLVPIAPSELKTYARYPLTS